MSTFSLDVDTFFLDKLNSDAFLVNGNTPTHTHMPVPLNMNPQASVKGLRVAPQLTKLIYSHALTKKKNIFSY